MAIGLFQSIEWLKKKVKSICCWLGIIEEYTGANLPYVEFIYIKDGDIPLTVNEYNNDVFLKLNQPADFSSFVEYNFGDFKIHRIYGSSGNLKLLDSVFNGTNTVAALNDPFGLIKEIGDASLKNNISLRYLYLPNVSVIGESAFMNSILTTIYIPKCTQLGPTVGDNNVFNGVVGLDITLKVNNTLLTCNAGDADGDIKYLQTNNTVVII